MGRASPLPLAAAVRGRSASSSMCASPPHGRRRTMVAAGGATESRTALQAHHAALFPQETVHAEQGSLLLYW